MAICFTESLTPISPSCIRASSNEFIAAASLATSLANAGEQEGYDLLERLLEEDPEDDDTLWAIDQLLSPGPVEPEFGPAHLGHDH